MYSNELFAIHVEHLHVKGDSYFQDPETVLWLRPVATFLDRALKWGRAGGWHLCKASSQQPWLTAAMLTK
jgi:hypothetical protein